jgi:hypothetical protein
VYFFLEDPSFLPFSQTVLLMQSPQRTAFSRLTSKALSFSHRSLYLQVWPPTTTTRFVAAGHWPSWACGG